MRGLFAADLRQNIIVSVYLLFSHNYIAFAYFFGLIFSLGLSLYRPSRFTTLMTSGFGVLLFSFEYDKHFIAAFRQQTIQSLITTQEHARLQRILDLIISDVLPVFFYILGWFFLFLAIFYAARRLGHPRQS